MSKQADALTPQKVDLSTGYEPEVGDVIAFRDVSGSVIRGPVVEVTASHLTVQVTRDILFTRALVKPFEVFRESDQTPPE